MPSYSHAISQRVLRLVIALGVASALFRVWLSASVLPIPPQTENMRVGITLASKGYFGDPFFTPTGPTAHVAPMYPTLIAAAIEITGSESVGFIVARCVVGVLLGAFIVLLPCIGSAVGFTPGIGATAGFMFLFPSPPVFMWIEATGQHETVLTALFMAALTAATMSAVRHQRLDQRLGFLLGIAWGIAMHASPTLLLPMVAAFAIPITLSPSRSHQLRVVPAVAVGFACAITPWMVRNTFVMGKPVFVRDNFGIELAMSNSDLAGADMRENMYGGRTMTRHPYFSSETALELRETGEIKYYQQKRDEALRWINEHPRAFLELTLQRVGLFFLPRLGWEHHAHFYVPMLILWLVGTLRLAVRDPVVALTLNGVLLAYALPHFFVQSSPRYSYPVLWIMVLIASYMAAVIFRGAKALARR